MSVFFDFIFIFHKNEIKEKINQCIYVNDTITIKVIVSLWIIRASFYFIQFILLTILF